MTSTVRMCAAVGLAAWGGLALAYGADPPGAPARSGPLTIPAFPLNDDKVCGNHGTSVEFLDDPREAAARAKKEQKLVFVLHVSGHFEDPRFTWNNAEALRVNALANPEVGKYLNEYFVASFQKVATFRIVDGQKQGGNVASYFCAPDGRVLHLVAGPVDAPTLLKEARWVVETSKQLIKESQGDGAKFKSLLRTAHTDRLRREHGLVVEPVTFDPPEQDENSALTYRDPSGRPLAPKLPPPPIDGPDVSFREAQVNAAKAAGAMPIADRRGRRWVLGNQGRVHHLMAAHSLAKIETVYGSVFEGILGEKVSTKPVEVQTPFPWLTK